MAHSEAPPPVADATGVIHCHTTYSDGSELYPFVLRAARQAGLQYLLMTDHDTLQPQIDVGEGYKEGLLLLIGVEITPRHNHYLAYNVADLPSNDLPPQQFIEAVAAQGGIGFCAHPHEYGSPLVHLDEYSWLDKEVTGFTGLELWNYLSSWVGGLTSWPRSLAGLVHWPIVARGPDQRTLAWWDELGARRAVVGIGGVDAHGTKLLHGRFTLHPYVRTFRTIRTHLVLEAPLSGNLAADRAAVLAALRAGRCYLVNWEWGNPGPFRFAGRAADGQWLEMGSESAAQPLQLSASLGRLAELRLLCNGRRIASVWGRTLTAEVDSPGVYRIEAHRRGRTWLLSNPIYLR